MQLMKKVALVDDHKLVRLGTRTVLEVRGDLEIVGEAAGCDEALRLIAETKPDLAIVDLVLGTDDGVAFVRQLKKLHENLRILVMTIQDESIYAERVIRAGAQGFISKADAAEKLSDAVDFIFADELFLSRESCSRILGRVLKEPTPHGDNPVTVLSDRELHVFQMIGTGFTTKQIAEDLDRSPKTIEAFRERIKTKLDFENAAELKKSAVAWVKDGEF